MSEVVKKAWGLAKAASILTKVNGKKRKVAIGQVREVLAALVKHDATLIKSGNEAEIIPALIAELNKKAVAKDANVAFTLELK